MPLDVTQDKIKSVQIRPWALLAEAWLFTSQTKAVLLAFKYGHWAESTGLGWKLGVCFEC